jgi:hypothetical protein
MKTDKTLTYLLILLAGLAVGVCTPHSWYASSRVAPSHTTSQASLLGR